MHTLYRNQTIFQITSLDYGHRQVDYMLYCNNDNTDNLHKIKFSGSFIALIINGVKFRQTEIDRYNVVINICITLCDENVTFLFSYL